MFVCFSPPHLLQILFKDYLFREIFHYTFSITAIAPSVAIYKLTFFYLFSKQLALTESYVSLCLCVCVYA